MSLVSIGRSPVVSSGSLVVPIGSNEAVISLPVGMVTVRLSQTANTSQVRTTGPNTAEVEMQAMNHMGEAYFDGLVGGLKFAINAQARIAPQGTYFLIVYSVTN